MSFFGFDTTLPRDRGHPSAAPGFSQAQDPFANLSRGANGEDDDDGFALAFAAWSLQTAYKNIVLTSKIPTTGWATSSMKPMMTLTMTLLEEEELLKARNRWGKILTSLGEQRKSQML